MESGENKRGLEGVETMDIKFLWRENYLKKLKRVDRVDRDAWWQVLEIYGVGEKYWLL